MNILELGRKTISWGNGVRRGWGPYEKDLILPEYRIPHEKQKWSTSKYSCQECGKTLVEVHALKPFTYILYACPDGHKYHHINTA